VKGFDRLYETARALGEETRFGIYRQICVSDAPLGVTELAQAFSLHPNAVRQHLARLEQAGLLVSRPDRPGGAGRPRRLYEPNPEPADLAHPLGTLRSLVEMLSGAVDTLSPDRGSLVEFGRRWGRTWALRRKRENGGSSRSRRGRANLLSRELAEWGWRPASRHRAVPLPRSGPRQPRPLLRVGGGAASRSGGGLSQRPSRGAARRWVSLRGDRLT
jgi:DNA-binding transcriptional ArsR family regulator